MVELLARVLDAHGVLDRWRRHTTLTATSVTGGGLWRLKGLVPDPNPRQMRVALHEERASVAPFGQPNWRTVFTANRIAMATTAGTVVRERAAPRDSFAGQAMNARGTRFIERISTAMRSGRT